MKKIFLLCTLFCAMMLLLSPNPALAQIGPALWVSATGSDANACSQAAPCATFQGAINKGGAAQINCLTSGNYGSFTVAFTLVVDCGTGNVGNILVSTQVSAITINATFGITVTLRHLSLNGLGATAKHGIDASSFFGGTLIVEDCTIHDFTDGNGIFFSPTSSRGLLQVSNTQVYNNDWGIFVSPASGQIATVSLSHVEVLTGNNGGVALTGNGVVAGAMHDSIVGGARDHGVFSNAGQAFFTVESSMIIANIGPGIATQSSGSIINVGSSTIGANGTGILAQSGLIISFGNNQISANGADGNFTSTTALK
jgi:hypothetical protein